MISVVDGFDGRIVYVDEPGPLADTSVRSELRAGQVWMDRSGQEVHISENPDNDEHPFYGSSRYNPRGRIYTSNGIRYGEDETGPSYLVRLIKDVEEKKVELDLSKPVYVKGHPDRKVVGIWGPGSHDLYMIEYEGAHLTLKHGHDLENIPEPKRRFSREAVLVTSLGGGEPYLTWDNCILCGSTILARINLIHTEGEGWTIEEIK